jgi:hypothetical protein
MVGSPSSSFNPDLDEPKTPDSSAAKGGQASSQAQHPGVLADCGADSNSECASSVWIVEQLIDFGPPEDVAESEESDGPFADNVCEAMCAAPVFMGCPKDLFAIYQGT